MKLRSKSSEDWIGYYRDHADFSRLRESAGRLILNSFQNVIQKEISTIVNTMLKKKRKISIISLGSGIDLIAYHLKKEFQDKIELNIFDISEECVSQNRRLFKDIFTYTVGDIFTHEFGSRQYDIVYNTGLLEHFPVPEQEIIISRIFSLLVRPGYYVTLNPHTGGKLYINYMRRSKNNKRWEYGDEIPIKSLDSFSTDSFPLIEEYPCCSLAQLSFLRRINIFGFILLSPIILFNRLFYSKIIDKFFGKFLGYYVILSIFRK